MKEASTIPPPVPDYLEHFKFWNVYQGALATAKPVGLQIPAGGGLWNNEIREIPYLGNPVAKNQKPIRQDRKDFHFVAYQLQHPVTPPRNSVRFTNQLADESNWTLSPHQPLLLVPAAKKHHEIQLPDLPPRGDHYICFAVVIPPDNDGWMATSNTKPHGVSLVDQFDDAPEIIEKLQPAYFCFPVEKRIDGKPPETPNEQNSMMRLAIYNIDPRDSYNRPVWKLDQFGKLRLQITDSAMLGVPSVEW